MLNEGQTEYVDDNAKDVLNQFIRYKDLFIRSTTHYYVSQDTQYRYREVIEPLDHQKIHNLIKSKREFAVDALNSNGQCTFAVFDIDISRKYILQNGDGGAPFKSLLEQALIVAKAIKIRLGEKSIKSYIEYSGYKGYHVWVFWERTISLKKQKLFFANVLLDLYIPKWIHVEKFPSTMEQQKIKLPLSYHVISGEQAKFLTDGEEQLVFISKMEVNNYKDEYIDNVSEVIEKTEKTENTLENSDNYYSEQKITIRTEKRSFPAHIEVIYT
jgi:hypothetical protein